MIDPPKRMTYDELMAACAADPLVKAICDSRVPKNVKSVAVRPGWTIGLMPEKSSGIEPTFPLTYTRRVAHAGDVMMNGVLIGQVKDWKIEEAYGDPVYELKADVHPGSVVSEWMKPIHIECTRERVAWTGDFVSDWKEPIYLEDHVNLVDFDPKRDPYYEEWFQRQRDAAAEAARWYSPRFAPMPDLAFAASKMDWDEEEVDTQPGYVTKAIESIPVPEYAIEAAPAGAYPQIDAESISKTDRCYLCARGQYLTRFFRNADDAVLVCVGCLYDHLNWELHEDGTLTPVPSR